MGADNQPPVHDNSQPAAEPREASPRGNHVGGPDRRPWHQLPDRTTRFSRRADAYAAHRPGYPVEAIDAILEGVTGLAAGAYSGAASTDAQPALRAADIGAGTGISAGLLADRGVTVTAIEPNDAMRAAAAPHPGVSYVAATAEATTLADASVDLVVCAQAFHWFEPTAALTEFARILRPGGRLALVWNVRDAQDPLAIEYDRILREAATHDLGDRTADTLGLLRARREFAKSARLATFPNEQWLTPAGLIGRANSASYAPTGGAARQSMEAQLESVVIRHMDASGRARLVMRTELYLAEVQ